MLILNSNVVKCTVKLSIILMGCGRAGRGWVLGRSRQKPKLFY